jgi:hypothetical protein
VKKCYGKYCGTRKKNEQDGESRKMKFEICSLNENVTKVLKRKSLRRATLEEGM